MDIINYEKFCYSILNFNFNGCSNMNLSDYKDKKPLLKLEEYLRQNNC